MWKTVLAAIYLVLIRYRINIPFHNRRSILAQWIKDHSDPLYFFVRLYFIKRHKQQFTKRLEQSTQKTFLFCRLTRIIDTLTKVALRRNI